MVIRMNDSLNSSLVRNSAIQVFWWIIFFPGFYSTDSFSAVSAAQSGGLENVGTASWSLYVRYFSFFGHTIPLLTLISGLALTYSVTCFAYSVFSRKIAAISSLIVVATPVVYAMGITLWHDIPFTSGLILISAFFASQYREVSVFKNSFWNLLFPGSILLTFKPNGLPTIVLFALFYFLLNRKKEVFKNLVSAIAIASIVTLGLSYLIVKESPINSQFAQQFMQFDISCFASTEEGKGFVERNIPGVSDSEGWSSPDACSFISRSKLSAEEKDRANSLIPFAWKTLVFEEPKFVLETHLRRHAYLLPIPIYGIPLEPFIHSNIEFKDRGISWAFPEVAEKARVLPRAWNAARGIFGWAGLWLLLMIVFLRFGSYKGLAPPILLGLSQVIILFTVAPIPDGRYALLVLITGQLTLIGSVVGSLEKNKGTS
jgi:4-amino-4-deoxy-L-arabinose transferase-like glycosyltransferase